MEIRTCEEYVIAELFDAKNEIDRLEQVIAEKEAEHQETIARLDDVMKSFQELKDLILKRSSLKRFSVDSTPYISFDSIWQEYSPEDFDLFTTIIPEILAKDSQE